MSSAGSSAPEHSDNEQTSEEDEEEIKKENWIVDWLSDVLGHQNYALFCRAFKKLGKLFVAEY